MNFWIPLRRVKVITLIVVILFASFFYAKVTDPNEIVPVFPSLTIEAVHNPSFGGFTPPPGDPVVGIVMNGESRAYPLSLLEWHGVVNDVISDVPIAVTYSFMSDSAAAYNRTVDGRILAFDVHKGVYRNNLPLRDDETRSIWSQLDGKAIKGPLTGTVLTRIPSVRTDWSNWKELHPSTLILEPPGDLEYGIHPYGDYYRNNEILFPHRFDDPSLDPKELVLGIDLNGSYSAYQVSRLSSERVVIDAVDSMTIVIAYANGAAFVYQAGDRSFTYLSDSTMQDQNSNRWNMTTGISENGTQTVMTLQESSIVCYWFAWLNFHPETDLYGFESRTITERSWLESAFPWIVGLLLCLFVFSLNEYSDRRMRDSSRPTRWIAFRKSILFAVIAFIAFSIVAWDSLGNLKLTNQMLEFLFATCFLILGIAMVLEWHFLKGYESSKVPIDISSFKENLEGVLTFQEIETDIHGPIRLGFTKTDGGFRLAEPRADILFSANWVLT
ncbi:MAG: DUF3179 domain-containing (seleno)protein, partial [Candidatus Thorarchaeota archaeon]